MTHMRGTARVLRLASVDGSVTVPVYRVQVDLDHGGPGLVSLTAQPKITALVLESTATRAKRSKLWRLANEGRDLGVAYDARARRGRPMSRAELEGLRVAFTRERAIALKVEVASSCVTLMQAQLRHSGSCRPWRRCVSHADEHAMPGAVHSFLFVLWLCAGSEDPKLRMIGLAAGELLKRYPKRCGTCHDPRDPWALEREQQVIAVGKSAIVMDRQGEVTDGEILRDLVAGGEA